jgi:hypothetical protein
MKKHTSKKTSTRSARKQWLDWEDDMLRHCRALDTLAGLLIHSDEEGLSPELVGDTGALIAREARQLKTRLQSRPAAGGPR